MQQIEQARVDVVHVASPEVPQQMIHCGERVRHVAAAAEVLHSEMLAGMRVRKTQCPGRRSH